MSAPRFFALDRRRMLQSGVGGVLGQIGMAGAVRAASASKTLEPVRAREDRLFDITVCLRPFRAAGPRLDAEWIGDALVVHNYGHGGSGWSLSWGSSTLAVTRALEGGVKDVAVIGCGALGLTSAILAQRAGAKVTIYAKEFLSQSRSSRATGNWSPASKIGLKSDVSPGFSRLWEQMTRVSYRTYRDYLGLAGDPVRFVERYNISDISRDARPDSVVASQALEFVDYMSMISDINGAPEYMPVESTPFQAPFVYRTESLMFNISEYGHRLMTDFLLAGGKFERREFHVPGELASLKEKVVINCPGYGARKLWSDESIIPVKSQIGWLIPQREINYGIVYKGVAMLPRPDGFPVQDIGPREVLGYNNADETVNRAETVNALSVLDELFTKRFRMGEVGI